ncbi:MAG: hypothetical protein ABIL62_00380, partial [Planctomycetota bacterium]
VCRLSSIVCQLSSALYICREPSTNQLLFMQNKPNLLDAQMNVSSIVTKEYENKHNWTLSENKPNSNPIKPNLKRAKMNVNSLITKNYRKKDDFSVRINKPNFRNGQNERKLTYNKGLQKKRCFRRPKNKPKQTQFPKGQNELKIDCQKIWPHLYFLRLDYCPAPIGFRIRIFLSQLILIFISETIGAGWGFRLYYQAWICKRGKNNE